MSLDDFLSFRHEASRAKWRKEIFRPQPPPFLGPLVSIKEAMEALNRSESYVRHQIDEGRLNIWKDPTTKRVWILKDDVEILKGDIRALEERGETRGGKRGPRKPKESQEPEEEDLDAIGGWEHPKPPPVVVGAGIEESIRESNLRYEQKQRENEEWYAAELAKLEDRDPEEAVRQLQIERGWLKPEPPAPKPETVFDTTVSVYDAARSLWSTVESTPRKKRRPSQVVRPISWSNPNPGPRKPVKPYIDPESVASSTRQQIIPSFPTGWITGREVKNIFQITHSGVCRLVREGKLRRRKRETGRAIWLYDSLEVEALAEARIAADSGPTPGKSLTWWGSRANPIELTKFDGWMPLKDAAQLLGITPSAVGALCDRGLLPARQKEPGKRGSRVYVPHHHVLSLSKRPEYQKRRAAKSKIGSPQSEIEVDPWDTGWPFEVTGKNLHVDHGEFYSQAQAARALGISVQAVHRLRIRGRLQCHHNLRDRKGRSGRFKWWFYRKADVDALRSDPTYADHHKRWVKTRNRKAGWDSPGA
jgi:hypothetical protein